MNNIPFRYKIELTLKGKNKESIFSENRTRIVTSNVLNFRNPIAIGDTIEMKSLSLETKFIVKGISHDLSDTFSTLYIETNRPNLSFSYRGYVDVEDANRIYKKYFDTLAMNRETIY